MKPTRALACTQRPFGNGRTLSLTRNLRSEPLAIASGPLQLGYTPTPAGDVGVVTDQSEDLSCVRGVMRSVRYDGLQCNRL